MKLNYLSVFLVLVLGITSCSSDDDSSPDPITKGEIFGSVKLFNESSLELDKSGMTITVEGTSPVITATTNSDGDFNLVNVPFGTYTIVYEKTGFGTFKKFDIEHTTESTHIQTSESLGQVSTTEITELTATVSGDNVVFAIRTDPAGFNGNRVFSRYFLSTSSDVNNEDYTYFSPTQSAQINPVDYTINISDLLNAGFTSGDTVYVKFYGESLWSNDYYDSDLERSIFPNLNTDASVNTTSFVMP